MPAPACTGCAGRPRDAEIHDHRLVLGVDHDVGGLQVPVDDTRLVSWDQAGDDPRAIRSCARQGQPAFRLQHGRQIGAVDVRHRDVLDAVDLAEIVNADDVLVGDLAGEQQLALESSFDFGRRGSDPP